MLAFVHLQEVLEASTAAQSAERQIGEYRTRVEQSFRQRQEELRQEEQELARRRSILSPQAFREEEQKFHDRVNQTQREFQEAGRELQRATFEVQQQIGDVIEKIIVEVANERGINMVFSQTQVYFVDPRTRFDISAEVTERLNEALPDVTVALPQN